MRIEDPNVLAALARLRHNRDFQRFVDDYLTALERAAVERCVALENPSRAQGAVEAVREIIQNINGAEEAFIRLSDNREVPLPNQ